MSDLSQELASTLVSCEAATPDQIRGCTEEEISSLEIQFGVKLPDAYKQFLLVLGKDGGKFENDALWTFDVLAEARRRAEGILEDIEESRQSEDEDLEEDDDDDNDEGGKSKAEPRNRKPLITLKPTDFVFLTGTCNFIFLDTTKGDDPPIQLVEESEDEPNKTLPSFSAWVQLMIDEQIECTRILKEEDAKLRAMGIEP